MEIEIELTFTAPDQHLSQWQAIIEGMCEGQLGATLQDRMAIFGEAVEDQLESMLDDWPMEYFEGQYCEQNGASFTLGLLAASDGDEFAEELEALFKLCGVRDLVVRVQADDE